PVRPRALQPEARDPRRLRGRQPAVRRARRGRGGGVPRRAGRGGVGIVRRGFRRVTDAAGSLPDPFPLPTLAGRSVRCTPALPGSKSLSNRVLLLAALARGESRLRDPLLDADDGAAMVGALRALGATIDASGRAAVVRGVGGPLR